MALIEFAIPFSSTESLPPFDKSKLKNVCFIAEPNTTALTPAVTAIEVTDAQPGRGAILIRTIGMAGDTGSVSFNFLQNNNAIAFTTTATADMGADKFAELIAADVNDNPLLQGVSTEVVGGDCYVFTDTFNLSATCTSNHVAAANVPDGIYMATNDADLVNITPQSAIISQAFDGGLNKVYICVSADNSNLETLLSDFEQTAHTIAYVSSIRPAPDLTFWRGVISLSDNTLSANTAMHLVQSYNAGAENAADGNLAYLNGMNLSSNTWRNQQYISLPNKDAAFTELGQAELNFSNRNTFAYYDDNYGTRLSGAFVGGKSLTAPYIDEQFKLDVQEKLTNLIASLQPVKNERSRLILEKQGQKILNDYIDNQYFLTGVFTLTLGSEAYTAIADVTTVEAQALWRVKIDATRV